MVVTLTFAEPKRLVRSRVHLSSHSQWQVETANTVAELDAMTDIPFYWAKTSFMWYGVLGCAGHGCGGMAGQHAVLIRSPKEEMPVLERRTPPTA